MNKRRTISWVIVICLFILSLSMAFAADVSVLDVNKKAQTLNKLGILSGDGKGNYNLSSSLKRSEAATFIVALLGKTKEVVDNKSKYIDTGFSDVKSTDWHAASVGFCKANAIISGIGQNKFGPKNSITEKAFLTMVMKAIGYTNEDFSSGNVYQKAYEIGLVTEDIYQDKTDDNKNYTRSQVVDVMYNALGLKIKNGDIILIKKLIIDGQISPQKAIEAGFVFDELPTTISQITVLSDEWIILRFNESIKELNDSNIVIYESSRKKVLPTKVVTQTGTEIRIKTDVQEVGREYGININNIIDSQNNFVKEVKTTFIGYENKEIKSDLFKISKVEQRSNNEIAVYFTHPININAERPEFYSIQQADNIVFEGNKNNISVKVMDDKSNAVILNTKDFIFQQDIDYTIKIKGSLLSAYGTNLGLEAGDQKIFIVKTMETQQFKLVGITSLNNKSIQLDFNKPVYKTTAEQVFSYYITEINTGTPIQIMKSAVSNNSFGKDCSIILTIAGTFDSKKGYNLLVNSIYDATKQTNIEEQKFTFNTLDKTNTDNKITSILPIDTNSVSISFEKKIDAKSAEDISNYSILCLNNTSYNIVPMKAVYTNDSPYSVKLYFAHNKPMTSGYLYRIKILTTFQDYTGQTLSTPVEYNYTANNIVKEKPEITKAAFIAKDTLKINFSKDIALDTPNILTQNYFIQMINDENIKKMPISINYIDRNTLVIKFDSIDFNNQYYFKFVELKDITGETYSGVQINTAIVSGE